MEAKVVEFDLGRVEAILGAEDRAGAEEYLRELPTSERARLLSRMDGDSREHLIGLLDAEFAADLIQGLGETQSIEILESVDADLAAKVVDHVPSDEQADLLSGCDEEVAEKILAAMSPEEAVDARELMRYEWDTAGGMMITEYLAYRETATVREVAEDMRSNRDKYANFDIQYVYVTGENQRLLGVLRLRDLVLARQDDTVVSLMIQNPISVEVTAGLHDLYHFFMEHHFLGLPVVDLNGALIGVLQRSDVEESMSEEATENYLKVSGLQGNEELRSMPLMTRSRRRLSWLSINIVLNVIAASVIAVNQDVLEKVIALAVFLPIISDMSGCSGNQAVGVSVRELTLGLVKPKEVRRVFLKELGVGLVNGFVLGLLVAVAGTIWQNGWFGLVVGTALMLNTIVAVLIGGLVPLILKGFKMDPALASGPILTTITDMCGFFFVLFFAGTLLERLV
ncbi:magnesium transporter [Puniceicoccus vermicola]|uniref:Magnesium transporter MgtE n=1 Tax=Puniceicoccus vermicola TaxID=388746 RepID=A0A7X1B250_9BACT|nr:magnesium transporter [Puniceicoccus vermicola]MBC2604223.1 magnesium transporter [Puniceicoccus vermicola]